MDPRVQHSQERFSCDVCGGAFELIHDAEERMFGQRGTFRYGECAKCGTLQLLDVPADMGKFYPDGYYSLVPSPSHIAIRALKYLRAKAGLRGWKSVSQALGFGAGTPKWTRWMRIVGLDPQKAICDVGCGTGDLLADMAQAGFKNVAGIDPFLPADTQREGIPLYAAAPDGFDGRFDLVMANHSFEHMRDPHSSIDSLLSLMKPQGTLLIRTPMADSEAWRRYGTEWVGLDAPRHLYIFTEEAIARLAKSHGLEVWHSERDSTELQFVGSELYRRGLSLEHLANSLGRPTAGFGRRQVRAWKEESKRLNRTGEGDSAAFYMSLTKA